MDESKQKKWPYIAWFISDWLGDPKVSLCEPATRGILFDWLCNMHALDRSGQVTGTRELLARIGRCTVPQCEAALLDLKQTNAADIQERNGVVTVINRRMKRAAIERKNGASRQKTHRERDGCHGDVTGHNQSQSPSPEPEIKGQFSQSSGDTQKLTKLTVENSSLGRIAREILDNRNGWFYDNCKVNPTLFQFPKSLVTVLHPFTGRVTEPKIHAAWQEAVTRTHKAIVDNLPIRNVASYTIQCWKEALTAEAQ
jgi:hypothetical protein